MVNITNVSGWNRDVATDRLSAYHNGTEFIRMTAAGVLSYPQGATLSVADDTSFLFGTSSDIAMRLRSTILAADTILANVIVGTPVVQAEPANSLIVSNITADGDIVLLTNTGGNSLESIRVDASAQQIQLGNGIFDVLVLNGNGLVVGHTAQVTVGGTIPEFQVLGTTTAVDGSMVLATASLTNTSQSVLKFAKYGGAAIGTFTTVAQGEAIGAIDWYGADSVDFGTVSARLQVLINSAGTVAENRTPSDMVFMLDPGGADDAIDQAMRLMATGSLVIGNGDVNTHANMTGPGLIIDQDTNDTLGIALKDSGQIATGLTTITGIQDVAVNDYFTVSKFAATTGGALIQAIGENAAVATNLRIESYGGQAAGTHTTAGRGLIELYASQHDGANALADLGNATNILAVMCRTGTADNTQFMVDENGEIWNNGTVTAFDDEDDVALVRSFSMARTPDGLIKNEWDRFVGDNEKRLVEMGILGDASDGGRPLVNVTKLQRLHNGALWQLFSDLMDVVKALPAEVQASLPSRMQERLALT